MEREGNKPHQFTLQVSFKAFLWGHTTVSKHQRTLLSVSGRFREAVRLCAGRDQ